MTHSSAPLPAASYWSEVFDGLRRHPGLSLFSLFCCIPLVAFAPDLTPRSRRGMAGGWALMTLSLVAFSLLRGA